MTTDGKRYLTRVVPWTEDTFVNVHILNKKFPGLPGRGFKNIDHALSYASFCSGLADVAGVFICMSSQALAEAKQTAKGKDYMKAVRRQENAVGLKSLWLDIDVKPNAYKTTEDAIEALKEFVTDASLPEPTVAVLSGSGGLHVYWTFNDVLTREEWQPLANALAEAAKLFEFKCDLGVTVDAARVLRLPGTVNRKGDAENPVKLIAMAPDDIDLMTMERALLPYMSTAPLPTTPVAQSFNLSLSDLPSRFRGVPLDTNLAAGLTSATSQIDLTTVAPQCGFVNEAISTGGASFDQGLWMMSVMLSLFVEDGLAMAHRMSCGHPTYTVTSTQDMYARLSKGKTERNWGWPKCSTIDTKGSAHCKSCPLRAQNKSPLNFATPIQLLKAPALGPHSTAPSNMHLPEPFFQTVDGLIMRTVTNDDGTQLTLPALRYPVSDAYLLDNPWSLHFTAQVGPGRVRMVEIPLSILHSKDKLPSKLMEQGILTSPQMVPTTRDFLMSWATKLQQVKEAVVSSTPFGWTVANGKIEGFTFAGRVWSANGDRPAAQPDNVTAKYYEPRGDIKYWLDAAKMITDQRRPVLDAIIGASFGAPLMRFTGEYGALFSVFSPESGLGKSTTMKVAAAVWGHYKQTTQALDDTSNSALGKMNSVKNLPILWDELKGEAQLNKFALMAFSLTQGVGKGRLNADITQRERGEWQTLLVSASNDTLIDPMARASKGTPAGLYRLFDVRVHPKHSNLLTGDISRMTDVLLDNFGHAGLVYAQFLGVNHKRVASEVATLHNDLAREVKAAQEERFWLALMAVIIAGAKYSNELALTDIDIPALRAFMIASMQDMRKAIKEAPNDVRDKENLGMILQGFLGKQRSRNMLVTDKFPSGQGRPTATKIMMDVTKLDRLTVHRAHDTNTIRVSQAALIEYLEERNHPSTTFIKALQDEMGATKFRVKLGAGTELAAAAMAEVVIEIDFNNAKLKGIT